VDRVQKKPRDEGSRLAYGEEFTSAPARQPYSLGPITLFVDFVLSAATSRRGAGRAMALAMAGVAPPLASPAWSTGRLGVLRVGDDTLTRPQPHAPDWGWIVEHTAPLGAATCWVILGGRLSAFAPDQDGWRQEHVEPFALFPVTQSTGQGVYEPLEQTLARTGVPRAMVRDTGAELHAGVSRLWHAPPDTASISDLKPQTALLFKHDLQSDATWVPFGHLAIRTRHHVQQTPLAALAPPKQRTQSRYRHVDRLVRWGDRLLAFLDRQLRPSLAAFDPAQIEAQ
jgi:hypothetical protein